MSHSTMTYANSCSEIRARITQIIDLLPPPSAADIDTEERPCIFPLDLVNPARETLNIDLANTDVSHSCHTALIDIFSARLDDLQKLYQGQCKSAMMTMLQKRFYEEAGNQGFRRALTRRYAEDSQRLWRALLDQVEDHSKSRFSLMIISDCDAEDQDSPGKPPKISRGHDSDAVRILEQAFDYTPNITQAEKFQLAEATGLQPKQVTIWFQNRRNRKGKKGPKLAITGQPDSDPSSSKNEPSPASPSRDFTLSEKKRKSYGALGRTSFDSNSYDSDSLSSLPKKPRLPSADSDVSDGSASSYEHHGAFTCWSTPSSRSNSSSFESSGLSDFDSPRKPRNVFDYMKPRTLDVKAITSMPRLTIPTQQSHASTSGTSGQRTPFLCDNPNGNVDTGTSLDVNSLQFNFDGGADDQGFRESVQKVLCSMSGYEADTSRNVSSSSWSSQHTTMDDDGWEDVDDSIEPQVNGASQGQGASMPTQVNALPDQEWAQANLLPRAQPAPLAHTSTEPHMGSNNVYYQPQPFDNDSFDLSQFFQTASMPTHMQSVMTFSQRSGIFEVPLPAIHTQEIGEIEKPLDMDMGDIQSILDSNIFASSLPSSQQSNGISSKQDASVLGLNSGPGAEMGEGVFQMNFDLDSNSFGFV